MRLPSPVIIVITRSLPSNEIQVQNTHSLAHNRCSLKVMLHTFKFLGHPFSKVSWHKGFIKITLGIVCHSKSPLGAPVFWGSLKQGNTQCWPSTHTHTHVYISPNSNNHQQVPFFFSFFSFAVPLIITLPGREWPCFCCLSEQTALGGHEGTVCYLPKRTVWRTTESHQPGTRLQSPAACGHVYSPLYGAIYALVLYTDIKQTNQPLVALIIP